MAWLIPDKDAASSNIQSIFFQEYLDVLVAGLRGIDCIISGFADIDGRLNALEVDVPAGGIVLSNGIPYLVVGSTPTIGTADATNPRFDLLVVNASGAIAVRAGTAAANPKPPARTANDVVLAAVYVPANATFIPPAHIIDLKVHRKFVQTATANKTAYSQTSATGTEVAGLSRYLDVGTYIFRYFIVYQEATATNAPAFGLNFTGNGTPVAMLTMPTSNTSTIATAVHDQETTTTPTMTGALASRTKTTTTPNMGPWASEDTANADCLLMIEGYIIITAAGELELWANTDGSTLTVAVDKSSLILQRVR